MILLIGHIKGGTGKSTLSVQIAAELQRRGSDVVLLEADPTVETLSTWARDRQESGKPPITCLKQTGNIFQALQDLDGRYGCVVVDVSGKDSPELRSAMAAADVFLAPVQPTQADLDATEKLVSAVKKARELNPGLKALSVINRASTHPQDTRLGEAKEYLDDFPELHRTDTVIYDRKVYQSIEDGGGAVESRNSKAKAEIQLLTEEILHA